MFDPRFELTLRPSAPQYPHLFSGLLRVEGNLLRRATDGIIHTERELALRTRQSRRGLLDRISG